MRTLDLPVLIAGAGPSGLMASLLLEHMGVETMVVELRSDFQRAPAAHVVNARTLEICRAAGVDMQALDKLARDPADAGWVHWVRKLGGPVLGRLPYERQGDDQLDLTPTPLRNLSQNRFEPLLLSALQAQGRAPHWSHEWESSEPAGEGVLSRVRDLSSDRIVEVRSRYLLAADGAGSRIRKSLEIPVEGPERLQSFVMVHFRASLRDRAGSPPGILSFVCEPSSGGGVFVAHDLDSEAVYMLPFDPDRESIESYDEARCAEIVRRALEDPDLDFRVENVSTWSMTAQVAERYRDQCVFLVGDAAHRFPPTGGLGLNTGVQDAHNLAWKLAAVLDGRAGAQLLDTYEQERRPVAQNNADQSLRNAVRLFEVPVALGITDESEASRVRMEEILADPEGVRRVGAAIANQAEHFDMPGLQLGFAYEQGALVQDGTAAPGSSDPRTYRPSGAPGHRLPHAWTDDRESRRTSSEPRQSSSEPRQSSSNPRQSSFEPRQSILDWVPLDRCLLLAGPRGESWLEAVESLADPRVSGRRVGEAQLRGLASWLERAGIDEDGALLVRPDQHVAWRARSSSSDPKSVLAAALRSVFFTED